VAVVAPHAVWTPPRVACVVAPDMRAVLAEVARRFYDQPQRGMELTAVCGTSGKTVVSHLLRELMVDEPPIGMLGTIHYALGRRTLPAYRTTPEPVELYGMLAQMRDAGSKRCVLEVSSHGIAQGRVAGLDFGVVTVLNLSPAHLDYHGGHAAYCQTIARLLTGDDSQSRPPARAVLGIDDPQVRALIQRVPATTRVVTFGLAADADFRAEAVRLTARDSRFRLCWPGGVLNVVSPLLGDFNVLNVLAAFATAWQWGADPVAMAGRLIDFDGVRGRMESVADTQPFGVLVDYAHTPESYDQLLATVRAITAGRVLCVFGCGGNRDRRMRPLVTRAVMAAADLAWATADNPRHETVDAIFADMRPALPAGGCPLEFVADRRQAIAMALAAAQPGDTVVIAGKGHETYQEFGDTVTPFDDRAVVREILLARGRSAEDVRHQTADSPPAGGESWHG
jgi:UDP-N-acetylmuramoyl-L-alanyl-D-glutamate--2,6-diaminopimelate ligase